jgi:hypothetical protein
MYSSMMHDLSLTPATSDYRINATFTCFKPHLLEASHSRPDKQLLVSDCGFAALRLHSPSALDMDVKKCGFLQPGLAWCMFELPRDGSGLHIAAPYRSLALIRRLGSASRGSRFIRCPYIPTRARPGLLLWYTR